MAKKIGYDFDGVITKNVFDANAYGEKISNNLNIPLSVKRAHADDLRNIPQQDLMIFKSLLSEFIIRHVYSLLITY